MLPERRVARGGRADMWASWRGRIRSPSRSIESGLWLQDNGLYIKQLKSGTDYSRSIKHQPLPSRQFQQYNHPFQASLASESITMQSAQILLHCLAGIVTVSGAAFNKKATPPPYFILTGDSTVTDNAGWGGPFVDLITGGVEGENRAVSGRTVESWQSNGRWDALLQTINETVADWEPIVTIQFGHNDQKAVTVDEYQASLEEMTSKLKDAGATPVCIVTPARVQPESEERQGKLVFIEILCRSSSPPLRVETGTTVSSARTLSSGARPPSSRPSTPTAASLI